MPLSSLKFRPGINREITSYSNEGGFFDCEKVRFYSPFPEKIGGWVKQSSNTYPVSYTHLTLPTILLV